MLSAGQMVALTMPQRSQLCPGCEATTVSRSEAAGVIIDAMTGLYANFLDHSQVYVVHYLLF